MRRPRIRNGYLQFGGRGKKRRRRGRIEKRKKRRRQRGGNFNLIKLPFKIIGNALGF